MNPINLRTITNQFEIPKENIVSSEHESTLDFPLPNEIIEKIFNYLYLRDLTNLTVAIFHSSLTENVKSNLMGRAKKCGYQGDDWPQVKDYLKYALRFINCCKYRIPTDLISYKDYKDKKHIDYEKTYCNLKFNKDEKLEEFNYLCEEELRSLANSEQNIEPIKAFLNYGINPNIEDRDGRTPLFEATDRGHKELMTELLKHQANPNIKTVDHGITPLHLAVNRGDKEMVIRLCEYKADPHIQNNKGITPLENAIHLVKVLRDNKNNEEILSILNSVNLK